MIIGALQAVEFPADKLDEVTEANLNVLKSICERKDIPEMALHEQAILFATLSKFIAVQRTDSSKQVSAVQEMEKVY